MPLKVTKFFFPSLEWYISSFWYHSTYFWSYSRLKISYFIYKPVYNILQNTQSENIFNSLQNSGAFFITMLCKYDVQKWLKIFTNFLWKVSDFGVSWFLKIKYLVLLFFIWTMVLWFEIWVKKFVEFVQIVIFAF